MNNPSSGLSGESEKATVEIIFEPDEMVLHTRPLNFNRKELLAEEALFFLRDVCPLLDVQYRDLTRRARQCAARGLNPYQIMGLRKIWNHWVVRMRDFAPYYHKTLSKRYELLSESITTEELLQKNAIYRMVKVCKHLKIHPNILRYRCKRIASPRKKIGVWKDPDNNIYLLNMPIFVRWLKEHGISNPKLSHLRGYL